MYSVGCSGKGINIWKFYAAANNSLSRGTLSSPFPLVILSFLCKLSTYCVPFSEAGAGGTKSVPFYQVIMEKCWRLWGLNNVSLFFSVLKGVSQNTHHLAWPSWGCHSSWLWGSCLISMCCNGLSFEHPHSGIYSSFGKNISHIRFETTCLSDFSLFTLSKIPFLKTVIFKMLRIGMSTNIFFKWGNNLV